MIIYVKQTDKVDSMMPRDLALITKILTICFGIRGTLHQRILNHCMQVNSKDYVNLYYFIKSQNRLQALYSQSQSFKKLHRYYRLFFLVVSSSDPIRSFRSSVWSYLRFFTGADDFAIVARFSFQLWLFYLLKLLPLSRFENLLKYYYILFCTLNFI